MRTDRGSMARSRGTRGHQGGRSKHWLKVKNRKHPAMERVMEAKANKVIR
jgi:hypothetical protein